ncbi:lytic transglycosylase domain-containing protein [Brucella intermedia]|uniref:lytic transglycosylase domain-containing protein n=1 Tax=Brucella TaxID=234 RepID=UPI0009464968|nr:lytic transglycosylase domain-containing protein [Brucella intermedia]
MSDAFVDLANSCAPIVQVETLAAIVSLESRFRPFNIRINSGMPLPMQPASKSEAIEIATALIADHQDIQIGLGGLGTEALRKMNLSLSDAFDPCRNLNATATLLDSYYRHALRLADNPQQAETVMLQSWYGRGDPSLGKMVRYDEQVRKETARLLSKPGKLAIEAPDRQGAREHRNQAQQDGKIARQISRTDEAASWDVFGSSRHSSVHAFQNDRLEQSE